MKPHIKTYCKKFNIQIREDAVSELSGLPGQAIHHIERRGMGGRKDADRIENLMCLTHEEHEDLGDKNQYKALLYRAHKEFLIFHNIEFDENWIDEQIEKWKYYERSNADLITTIFSFCQN